MRAAIVVSGVWLSCGSGCYDVADHTACDSYGTRMSFAPVSNMLGARCGSLDCHGQTGRPLRIYSSRGLRLDPEDLSGHGGTRSAEHEANFLAVVSLEPELTCDVLRDHGRDPERLSLVRKSDGGEAHKGGAPLRGQQDGRACLLDWLAGTVDDERCALAAELERPL